MHRGTLTGGRWTDDTTRRWRLGDPGFVGAADDDAAPTDPATVTVLDRFLTADLDTHLDAEAHTISRLRNASR